MSGLKLEDLLDRLEKMEQAIKQYSKAKAERVYIEQFLKSKKAILMHCSTLEKIGAKEAYALAHPEYLQLLDGLKAAVEIEEKAKWCLERLKIESDLFRTVQANDRYIKNAL
jgi:hypothetical protein